MFQNENIEPIRALFIYFLIAGGVVLTLVIFFVIYYSIKYRRRSAKSDTEPEQSHGSKKFEIFMVVISLLLVGIFFVFSLRAMNQIQDLPEHPTADIEIIGHQWWWEVRYPDGFITANEIHIPAGENLIFKLSSSDVIHSFWVPRLARKMDMFPGFYNYLKIRADKPGIYDGSCSEFCGAQHALMKIKIIAENQAEYAQWKERMRAPARQTGDSLFMRGKSLFEQKTCGNCHSANPAIAEPNIGPNLGHFASRSHFLSNIKPNKIANVKAWLRNPDNLKHGAKMPNLILTSEEVNALAEYISHLK